MNPLGTAYAIALSQCLMMQLKPASAGCTFPVPVEMDQTSEI